RTGPSRLAALEGPGGKLGAGKRRSEAAEVDAVFDDSKARAEGGAQRRGRLAADADDADARPRREGQPLFRPVDGGDDGAAQLTVERAGKARRSAEWAWTRSNRSQSTQARTASALASRTGTPAASMGANGRGSSMRLQATATSQPASISGG